MTDGTRIERTDDARPASRAPAWLVAAIAIGFGLLYAYDLFEAISNLFGVVGQLNAYNELAAEEGLDIQPIPWALLLVGVALPPAAYAVAWLLGRTRSLGMRALLFLGGLAVVAALSLSLIAFA